MLELSVIVDYSFHSTFHIHFLSRFSHTHTCLGRSEGVTSPLPLPILEMKKLRFITDKRLANSQLLNPSLCVCLSFSL